MKPGSDTAKQDLLLMVAGLVALLLFFWLYSDFHPLPVADISLGESTANKQASEFAREFGFNFETEPVTYFQTDTQLLDSLQKQTKFKEFYSNSSNSRLFPAFYWQTNIKMGSGDEADEAFFDQEMAETIEIRLSEGGRLIGVFNEDNLLPQSIFRPDVLHYGMQTDSLQLSSISNDSLIAESLEFRFNNNTNQAAGTGRIDQNEVNYLGTPIAQRMAEYYLAKSGWPEQDFTITSVERVSIGDSEGALVRFENSISDIRTDVQVEVRILPAGSLVSMDYTHPSADEGDDLFTTIKTGIRTIVLLVGAFWIIVLLFIRFRLRLVDIKAATLVAVLAGMIFPLVLTLESVYSHLNSFGVIDTQFVFMQLIVIGFSAAFATLGFFVVTAISDSITRQSWSEKLRTVDVLRVGYFNNIPVGLAIIRESHLGFSLLLAGV